jgi:SAM-dependent methyltransferase
VQEKGIPLSNKKPTNNERRLQESRQYWNGLAPAFDDQSDHGLRQSFVWEAWKNLLSRWLPSPKATILDIGCGTGSLSTILAGLGHAVTGIDLSPAMISLAEKRAKLHGYSIHFQVMDAAFPELPCQQYDVIVCRHLLWAFPEPQSVLSRWIELLKQGGRLILIEGYWGTGVGLHAKEIIEWLPPSLTSIALQNLGDDPNFWGRVVPDERYALIADFRPS